MQEDNSTSAASSADGGTGFSREMPSEATGQAWPSTACPALCPPSPVLHTGTLSQGAGSSSWLAHQPPEHPRAWGQRHRARSHLWSPDLELKAPVFRSLALQELMALAGKGKT